MRPILVVLVLASLVVTPGCLRDFEEPSRIRIRGIDVAAPTVASGRATLEVTTTLDNAGGASAPLRLEVKAYSTQTGLRVARNATDVGSLDGETTQEVRTRLEVPRRDGVRIEVVLFEEDQATRTGRVTVDNVGALEPNLRSTGLSIRSIDFHVEEVGPGNDSRRVRIDARVYVTQEGSARSGTVEMQVKAREVSTDLIADERRRDVGDVGPEETRIFPVTLDVPDGFNYEVEAVLWDGAFIVERGSGHVQLLPERTVQEGEEIVVSDPDLRDLQSPDRDGGSSASDDGAEPTVPGFEVPAIVVSAVAAALWMATGRKR